MYAFKPQLKSCILRPVINLNIKLNILIVLQLMALFVSISRGGVLTFLFGLLFVVIFIIALQFIKNEGNGIIVLLNFYIQEFFFNLKLIINDLVKLIHMITN